jgi:hypothetical protein
MNHNTAKRNKRARRIQTYAKRTGASIDAVKQDIDDKRLTFDTKLDIYKSGEIPPDPNAHYFNLDVDQEEYDLIMRMRTIKRKYCELEFAEIKKLNEAEQLEEEDNVIANDSEDEPAGKPEYNHAVHYDPGTTVIVNVGNKKFTLQKKLSVNFEWSKFVKLTNVNEVALTSEDMKFFSTIEKGATVILRGLQIMEDEYYALVDIHEVIVHSNTRIEFLV